MKLRKMYTGILKHFDAQRKCGYIYSLEAEAMWNAMVGSAFNWESVNRRSKQKKMYERHPFIACESSIHVIV